MQPFFDLLKDNVWWEIILLVVVLLVIIGFYYYLEVKGEKVNREGQIMFTAIVTAVYVFQSSLSSMFEWPTSSMFEWPTSPLTCSTTITKIRAFTP